MPAGATEPVVIGLADLAITDGTSSVYAVGSLDAGSLTVLTETIEGLGTEPACANIGNSPIDEDTMPLRPLAAAGILGLAVVSTVAMRRRTTA
ncbi:MAG: hypothetical protein R2705_14350 [Ilumatobacteraceae bacterium]